MFHAILFSSALLLVGFVLRVKVGWLRKLYMPAAVVAGLVGLVVLQVGQRLPGAPLAGVREEMSSWPAMLIAVVFAGLLLERSGQRFGLALRRGARSGILAWIIILGQILIGVGVYLVAVPRGITPTFSQLLEVSWAGGHGSSAAMGRVYYSLGFPAGQDIAYFLATVGLVYGVLGGLLIVNIAIRRGWTHTPNIPGPRASSKVGDETASPPIAFAKCKSEVMEPMVLQMLVLAAAVGIGYGYQQGFIAASNGLFGEASNTAKALSNIPLFLFTLLGGITVRHILALLGQSDILDSPSLQRLYGVAMTYLIVAALATMRLESLAAYWLPICLLLVGAMVWSLFTLLVLVPRLLPREYWFELGLLNFGFSTANTPQGLLLLRIVDPDLKSGAAEDYAVAAPLSAPFIGGGVLTVAGFPYLLQFTPPIVFAGGLVVAMVALYALGRQLR